MYINFPNVTNRNCKYLKKGCPQKHDQGKLKDSIQFLYLCEHSNPLYLILSFCFLGMCTGNPEMSIKIFRNYTSGILHVNCP